MATVTYDHETDPQLRPDENLTWPPRGTARVAALLRRILSGSRPRVRSTSPGADPTV